jgi:probable rRNA maturation factor
MKAASPMKAASATAQIDIAVESPSWDVAGDLEPMISAAIQAGLSESGIAIMPGAEISIMLCDDALIRTVNKQWRGIDEPTNVLSFPAVPPARLKSSPMLGDIVIAFETVAREAQAEDKPFADHIAHLTIHGLLHLLGFDHETTHDAEIMEACEVRALARLGLADPYANGELQDK